MFTTISDQKTIPFTAYNFVTLTDHFTLIYMWTLKVKYRNLLLSLFIITLFLSIKKYIAILFFHKSQLTPVPSISLISTFCCVQFKLNIMYVGLSLFLPPI